MRLSAVIFMFVFVALLAVGEGVRREQGSEIDIRGYMENVTWAGLNTSKNNTMIDNLAIKMADTIGFAIIEVRREIVIFSYENPQYNFDFFLNLAIWFVYISILVSVFPLIVPCLALTCSIIDGIKERHKRYKENQVKKK